MRPAFASAARTLVLAAALCTALSGLGWLGRSSDSGRLSNLSHDERQYAALAGLAPAEAGHPVHLPFTARILVPSVVRTLPLPPEMGFRALAAVALAVALLALIPLATSASEGLDRVAGRGAAVVAASLYFPTLYTAVHPFLADALFLMAWTLALLAVVRHRVGWAAVCLCAAVLTREAALFLVPAAAVIWWGERPWQRTARDLALLTLPALVLYLAVLCGVGGIGWGGGARDGGLTALAGALAGALADSVLVREPRALITGALLAGGLPALAVAVGWRRLAPRARRLALAGGVAVAPLLLLASDAGRMLGAAAPFWIPVAVVAWRTLPRRAAPLAPALAVVSNLLLATAVLTEGPPAAEAALAALAVLLALAPLPFLRGERLTVPVVPDAGVGGAVEAPR